MATKVQIINRNARYGWSGDDAWLVSDGTRQWLVVHDSGGTKRMPLMRSDGSVQWIDSASPSSSWVYPYNPDATGAHQFTGIGGQPVAGGPHLSMDEAVTGLELRLLMS